MRQGRPTRLGAKKGNELAPTVRNPDRERERRNGRVDFGYGMSASGVDGLRDLKCLRAVVPLHYRRPRHHRRIRPSPATLFFITTAVVSLFDYCGIKDISSPLDFLYSSSSPVVGPCLLGSSAHARAMLRLDQPALFFQTGAATTLHPLSPPSCLPRQCWCMGSPFRLLVWAR